MQNKPNQTQPVVSLPALSEVEVSNPPVVSLPALSEVEVSNLLQANHPNFQNFSQKPLIFPIFRLFLSFFIPFFLSIWHLEFFILSIY
jgi:hypothetical protein